MTLAGGGLGFPMLPTQTLAGDKEKIPNNFLGYVQAAYASNGIVFACMAARMRLFSEVRFQYRQRSNGRAGELYGKQTLQILEEPWPKATTGQLALRAIQDVDLAGNFYLAIRPRQGGGRMLRRLRPDWVTIVKASKTGKQIDDEVVGYMYQPKNHLGQNDGEPEVLLPSEVVHWAPIPDPMADFRGMSWLTPVIREIEGDTAATKHQLKFFENGGTVNLVVTLDPTVPRETYDTWVDAMEEKHRGLANAYRTMYLGAGADAKPVGANMKEMEFSAIRAQGETRISAAAGIPPVLVGLSEGLKASTYSNYQSATRSFADTTMRPLWRDFAGAMAPVVPVPEGSELWYDDRDIAFLKEDAKDAVEVQGKQAETLRKLIEGGYEPDSVVAAVEADDWSLLVHTGYVSVQMWMPGEDKSAHTP